MKSTFLHSDKKYLSSIEASARFGITNDYVSLLCRQGKVEGERIGRQWFVDPDTLQTFLQGMQVRKAERSRELSNQIREEYAAVTVVSAPTMLTPPTVWEKTFAPKRAAWYTPLFDTRIEPHIGIATLVALPFFIFGITISAQAFESSLSMLHPLHVPHAVSSAPEQTNPLVADVAYVTHSMHVPSAYVDSSLTPPPITAPVVVIPKQTIKSAVAFVPLFAKSLGETTQSAWQHSFGAAGTVFVASVDEFGGQGASVVSAEFNMVSVWDAWTTKLSTILYPVTPTIAAKIPAVAKSQTVQATAVAPKVYITQLAPEVNLAGYVTQSSLSAQLSDVTTQMHQLIYNQNAISTSSLYASLWGAIALSSRIDSLPSTVTINNSPIVTQATMSTPSLASIVGMPTYGQILVGNASGGFDLLATSSLGITGGGVSLTGTAGQLAYFSGTNTAVGTSTVFISTAGNVGVGTVSPSIPLDVQGTATVGIGYTNLSGHALIKVNGAVASQAGYYIYKNGVEKAQIAVLGNTNDLSFAMAGTDRLHIASGGNIGIGNSSPNYLLDVAGLGHFTGLVDAPNFVATSSAIASIFKGGFLSLASSTIGNGTQAGGLTISGGATTTGNAYFGGNVGINTKATSALLDIVENASNSLLVDPGLGAAPDLTVTAAHTVGLGTTTPWARLSLTDPNTGIPVLLVADKNNNPEFTVDANGFTGLNISNGGAASSLLSVNGGAAIGTYATTNTAPSNGLIVSGKVGIGTSSPFARLSVQANNGDTTAVLFAIGSSTQSATSTLFSVNNTGSTTLFQLSSSLLKTNANGTIVAAVAGIDYLTSGTTFAYPFPAGATSSLVAFNGGATFVGATTTALAVTGSSTISGTLNAFGTLNFANNSLTLAELPQIAANSILVNNTSATGNVTAIATSSIFGTGTPGQVLAWNNGAPQWIASTTYASGAGISTSFANGQLTITNTGALFAYPFPAGATSSLVAFNGGLTTTGATSTGTFSVTGSTTLASLLNVGGALNANSALTVAGISTLNGGLLSIASSTIGNGLQAGGLTISGGATTTGSSYIIGALSVVGAGNNYFNGNIGVGTSTPYSKLSIWGANTTSGTKVFEVTNSASTTSFSIDNAGFISAGSSNGTQPSNLFTIDASTGSTTIANLSVGNIVFDTDAGLVGLSDIPVDSNASANVRQAQSISIGGNPLITASAIANGSGGLTNFGVAIGTSTNPYAMLQIWGPDAASSTPAFTIVNNSSTTVFAVFDGGNAQLSGTLTQSSDQRLKTNIASLDASSTLAALMQLNPVTFNWIDASQGGAQQVGFIAQQVQQIFPNLVSTSTPTPLTPDGTLGVNYIGFVAPIIEAIKALVAEVNSFATQFTTKKLCVADDSGASTCITKSQLDALLANASQRSAASDAPAPTSNVTAPVPADVASSTPANSSDTATSSPNTNTGTSTPAN